MSVNLSSNQLVTGQNEDTTRFRRFILIESIITEFVCNSKRKDNLTSVTNSSDCQWLTHCVTLSSYCWSTVRYVHVTTCSFIPWQLIEWKFRRNKKVPPHLLCRDNGCALRYGFCWSTVEYLISNHFLADHYILLKYLRYIKALPNTGKQEKSSYQKKWRQWGAFNRNQSLHIYEPNK